MPFVDSVSTIDFPDKVEQQKIKEYVRHLFSAEFPQIDRMLPAFDNTEIKTRNFCKPLSYYATPHSFEDRNNEYINCALQYSIQAIEQCIRTSAINKEDITDIVFISTTGLATPSLDALIINKMRLSPYINRTPVFGLGCAGGVSGFAKASTIAKANSKAIVLLVSVELCSLTFMKKDISKSNFIATSLFSDGVVACIIKGDDHKKQTNINFIAAQSHLYYDSLDVMGWDFKDDGFKVIFSQSIPAVINKHVKEDIEQFLSLNHLRLNDIKNFIFHPGGRKVLEAYTDALQVKGDFLLNTRETMNNYGNMSSCTVLYVLNRFMEQGFEDGYGLMLALGPGFSSEMSLLKMQH
jgi:alkylresorcinol/alkylpyrone synthase